MNENDKNIKSPLTEYQRYIRGEMTKKEENSFLGKFQDDPFAEKATVSFSGISPREPVDNKDTPLMLLKNWFIPRKRVIFFSAVALVVVLLVIYSIFIILDKNKTAKGLINENANSVTQEVTDSNHITGLIHEESKSISDSMEIKVNHENPSKKIDTAISAGTNSTAITENPKALALTMEKDSTPFSEKGQISTPAMESGTKEKTGLNIRVNIVTSENNQTDKKQPGYIYPQPTDGISNFNRYIEENMTKPMAQTPGVDSVVVISFKVLTTGTIDSIRVINSPGDEFARKAISLIREGPAWKPAENNGQTINDEVRIRIVFK